MAEALLLEVREVSKAFGGVQAVAGVSFGLRPGEVQAMIGPNGAGKSTLFNMLTGQLVCDRGRILFRGERIDGAPPHQIWRRGISRTFQVPAVFQSLTVRENVQTALLSRRGMSGNLAAKAGRLFAPEAEAVLAQVGLLGYADDGCGTLSLGDLKRIELALALASEPALLLLDEPTAGMSSEERADLMETVVRIVRERNLTVLFTEHDMDVVFGTATRILVLHQGRVLAEGAPADVRGNPEVQRVYLGGAL
ncbi:MAG: transporter ATP-binding protein [candidate division NC10 bacterium]|nr:transporter ATP-binding protein [candidate division NC10 bacterium]